MAEIFSYGKSENSNINVMIRNTVKSSNIHSIGYEQESFTLEIQFLDRKGNPGPIYQYNPVTPTGYKLLMSAKSFGEFFSKNIKSDTAIKCTKVDPIGKL